MSHPLTTKEKLDIIQAYDNALGPVEFKFVYDMVKYTENGWFISDKRKAWVDRIYDRIDRIFVKTGIPH